LYLHAVTDFSPAALVGGTTDWPITVVVDPDVRMWQSGKS